MMRRLFAMCSVTISTFAFSATQVSYYFGEVKVLSPDGTGQTSSLALAKRTVDAAKKAIIEQIVHVPTRGPAESHVNVIRIEGRTFNIKDAEGKFQGTGRLFGKPWQWNRSEATAELLDGKGFFRINEHFSESAWVIKRQFFDDKGRLKWIYSEERKRISETMYEMLSSKLLRPLS